MKIELRRYINSASIFIVFGLTGLCFLLGYILLFTIDKVYEISLPLLFESVYTVYTQFGMFVLSPFIISNISSDYKDKNILFYKTINISPLKYYVNKVVISIITFSLAVIVFSTVMCIIYSDFSIWNVMISYFVNVIIAYILIISLWAFIFRDFIVAFFVNFTVWIIGIVISSISEAFSLFAYYDASSPLYLNLMDYMDLLPNGSHDLLSVSFSVLYNLILFLICIIIVFSFKRRWIKNGV
ncbi:MAG: hypothetical protein PHC56_04585 [Herbinix sp.]|nr:hypothetical protein [Herbinix sp.]